MWLKICKNRSALEAPFRTLHTSSFRRLSLSKSIGLRKFIFAPQPTVPPISKLLAALPSRTVINTRIPLASINKTLARFSFLVYRKKT